MPPDWDREGREEPGVELEQIQAGGELDGLDEEGSSLYFTPTGTPLRDGFSPGGEAREGRRGHRRMVSNLSSFLPFWWGMGQADGPVTTVAIVEPQQERWNTDPGTVEDGRQEMAPLAKEENLSLLEDEFTDAISTQEEGAEKMAADNGGHRVSRDSLDHEEEELLKTHLDGISRASRDQDGDEDEAEVLLVGPDMVGEKVMNVSEQRGNGDQAHGATHYET